MIRGTENERKHISYLENLMIPNPTGQSVPLSQIASLAYDFEEGVILRRNRVPTITVRANVYGKIQAPTVSNQIEKQLIDLKRNLPMGYWIEAGGAAEESIKGSQSIAAGIPLLIFSVLLIRPD
ncbi:efflux RND transporter permease subunit [Nitrosomonas sp. wSCUT-2]